ncbi:unnamed protein product [Penicillium olsonii]|nr:unnamed protein product [Penicillium olsonii]
MWARSNSLAQKSTIYSAMHGGPDPWPDHSLENFWHIRKISSRPYALRWTRSRAISRKGKHCHAEKTIYKKVMAEARPPRIFGTFCYGSGHTVGTCWRMSHQVACHASGHTVETCWRFRHQVACYASGHTTIPPGIQSRRVGDSATKWPAISPGIRSRRVGYSATKWPAIPPGIQSRLVGDSATKWPAISPGIQSRLVGDSATKWLATPPGILPCLRAYCHSSGHTVETCWRFRHQVACHASGHTAIPPGIQSRLVGDSATK